VLLRTIVYDPDLTPLLPPAVGRGERPERACPLRRGVVGGGRQPYLAALATDAARRFSLYMPRAVADGGDREARGECLIAAWLAGIMLAPGTALQHKLAHVLGGLGLPHGESHAIILPHVTRFNLAAAPQARAQLALALGADDPAARIADMLEGFPIPHRLRDIGFDRGKIEFVAGEMAKLGIAAPRPVSGADVRNLLEAAY
jgi:maleylacetate reductase